MPDIAQLGIEAKHTGVDQSAKALDRLTGAAEAVTFLRHLSRISPPAASFDAAFDTSASGADHE